MGDKLVAIGDGLGGTNAIQIDSGYVSRSLGTGVAMGRDWLDGAPNLTPALVNECTTRMGEWMTWVHRPETYGIGEPMIHPNIFEMIRITSEAGIRTGMSTNATLLDDRRLADLLNWMLRTYSPGQLPPDFEPYTEQEVSAWRKTPLKKVLPERDRVIRGLVQAGVIDSPERLAFKSLGGTR